MKSKILKTDTLKWLILLIFIYLVFIAGGSLIFVMFIKGVGIIISDNHAQVRLLRRLSTGFFFCTILYSYSIFKKVKSLKKQNADLTLSTLFQNNKLITKSNIIVLSLLVFFTIALYLYNFNVISF